MNSVYERDHVLVEIGDGGMADDVISIGHNFETVLTDLETRMREAAADLNFEEAARLRDEVKRLRATELAVVDDPTAKQRTRAGQGRRLCRSEEIRRRREFAGELDEEALLFTHPCGGGSRAAGARGGVKSTAVPPPPASTNPISTKCTARNPCPTAPAAPARENLRPTTSVRAAEAKSSSRPTRANPARNSAPPPAPAAAPRGIAAGGRKGEQLGVGIHRWAGGPLIISGCADWRRPGIHTRSRGCGFRVRATGAPE